jgi:hypothetical protein
VIIWVGTGSRCVSTNAFCWPYKIGHGVAYPAGHSWLRRTTPDIGTGADQMPAGLISGKLTAALNATAWLAWTTRNRPVECIAGVPCVACPTPTLKN